MRLLVSLPAGTREGAGDPQALVEIGRQVEAAGLDGVVISDHVLMGNRTDRYQWGPFPFPSEAPWLEPLTVLTAMAAVTERIVLTTGVLIVPLRPASLLAKTVATIDLLSGGRLELGVGTGWQPEEFTAQNLDPEKRGELLTDFMAACRALWTDAPASFSSPSVAFEEVWSEPRPLRPGGPAILFSGTLTARNVRRIVQLGDGWIPIMGATFDDIASGVEHLRGALADAGRDPGALQVRAPLPVARDGDGRPDLAATLAGAGPLEQAGVTEVSVPTALAAKDLAGLPDGLAELAARWVER
jgi:probable F420-dependent oxidoreductase